MPFSKSRPFWILTNRPSTQICFFKLQSILDQEHGKSVTPFKKTRSSFSSHYEFSFDVPSNQRSVFSITELSPANFGSCYMVLKEKWNTKTEFLLNHLPVETNNQLNSVLLLQNCNSLLALCYSSGCIFQFNTYTGKVQKKYALSYSESLTCAFQYKQLVFFGGLAGTVGVIDLDSKKCQSSFACTAIRWVYSIQVCEVHSKGDLGVYLAVTGENSDYTEKTDLFDISDVFKR